MHFSSKYSSILLSPLPCLVQAKRTLLEDYSGAQFFSKMDFFSGPDPTTGHVQYLDMPTANSTGIAGLFQSMHSDNTVYLGTDSTNPSPNGRPSVRVESQRTYDSGIFILDASNMPGGACGAWPAYWLLGTAASWPQAGEVDIIEGVNLNTDNIMALHVDGSFIVNDDTSGMISSFESLDGDVNALDQPQNKGAVAAAPANSKTFGTAFNQNMGGVYATEVNLAAKRISIWFFPRESIPADITSDDPQPSTWGKTLANFAGDDLDFAAKFKKMQIIINLTFCGEWAGNPSVWGVSECAKLADTCEAYVSENPKAFEVMYWAINSLKVFEADESDSTASSSSTPSAPASSSSEIVSIQTAPETPAPSNPTSSSSSSSETENPYTVPTSAPPGTAIPRIPYGTKQSSASDGEASPVPTGTPLQQFPQTSDSTATRGPWTKTNGNSNGNAFPSGAARPSGGFHRPSGRPHGQTSYVASVGFDSPAAPPSEDKSALEARHNGEDEPRTGSSQTPQDTPNLNSAPHFTSTRGPPNGSSQGGQLFKGISGPGGRWNGTGAPYQSGARPTGMRPSGGAARPSGAVWQSGGGSGGGFRTMTRPASTGASTNAQPSSTSGV